MTDVSSNVAAMFLLGDQDDVLQGFLFNLFFLPF